MQVFTLAVLPGHSAQMPVLIKNMVVQGGEVCICQDGPRVLPIPKGKGGQDRMLSHLHLCFPPRSDDFSLFSSAATVTATATAVAAVVATATATTAAVTTTFSSVYLRTAAALSAVGRQFRNMNRESGAPPSRLISMGSSEKVILAPSASMVSISNASTHLLSYMLHRCSTLYIIAVAR